MFEQAFKNIDDVLWKDAGCTSELDCIEQSSWLLFLKHLDALEPRQKPERGDDLYAVTGSFGIPVTVPGDTEFCFQRHIGLARPKHSVSTRWFYTLLLSPQLFKQANEGANGAAQKSVSLKLLRNFVAPSDLTNNQEAIVAKLGAFATETRRLENLNARKQAALAALKKSLQHQAFAGEL